MMNRGEIPDGYKKTKVGIVPSEWDECRFKQKFLRLTRKNKENNTNVLTISAQYGLINQEDFFNKKIASDDKSNYYLLNKGEFAYNKSYSNGYPFGALKQLTMYDKGVVSPLYICFSASNENRCSDFYVQYFEAGYMNKEIQAVAQEGARNHGLLNIAVDDFFNAYLLSPALPEQQKIAEILTTQDKLIESQAKKVDELKKLKKAYLQKIFPQNGENVPEIRFKGFTNAWEQRKLRDVADIVGGGTPSTSNSEYWDGDIDWYAPAEISDQIYIESSERKITPKGFENSSAKMLPIGTVLFTSRAGIGKTAILRKEGCTNQGFQSIVPHINELDSYFIFSRTEELKRYGETTGQAQHLLRYRASKWQIWT